MGVCLKCKLFKNNSKDKTMKKTFFALILIISAINAQVTYNFSRIDKILADSVSKISGIGGGYTFMLIKDGKEIYNKSFNTAGNDYSEIKYVPIASASKWISASVIASLIDAGLIKLDDTVSKFLPLFKGTKSKITIRQLFSHTSGFAGNTDYYNDKTLTLKQAADSIALNVPLQYAPGAVFDYGGTSMQIAGRIAEVVTGKRWDSTFNERIAKPVNMYLSNYNGLGKTDNPQIGGAVQSSAREYSRFLTMILNKGTYNGKTVLSQNVINEMQKDQTANAIIFYSPYQKYNFLNPKLGLTRYGLGEWLEKVDTISNESIEIGSQGAFGFSPWIDKKRNMIGIFSVFSTLEAVEPTVYKLKQLVRDIIDSATITAIKNNISDSKKTTFELLGGYPNPFNPSTTLKYRLGSTCKVSLKVYNILGNEIATLINGNESQGEHNVVFNAGNFSSGMYIVTLKAGNYIKSIKINLIK